MARRRIDATHCVAWLHPPRGTLGNVVCGRRAVLSVRDTMRDGTPTGYPLCGTHMRQLERHIDQDGWLESHLEQWQMALISPWLRRLEVWHG